jgi:transcriptional regulator with XRE-family HTH domain
LRFQSIVGPSCPDGECEREVSTTIHSVIEFPAVLREARVGSGLTQAELSERSGVARPNITAYESGRREPLFHGALELLEAAGAEVAVDAPVAWSWADGRRPYAVPSRLWRLTPGAALRRFDAGAHLWWSGPPRSFDLSDRQDRLRAYEIVLREGAPADIEQIVDGVLLCEAWSDLVLPRHLRSAWSHLVELDADSTIRRAAS